VEAWSRSRELAYAQHSSMEHQTASTFRISLLAVRLQCAIQECPEQSANLPIRSYEKALLTFNLGSQFLPTRSRHSRRSSQSTRSFKKAIPSFSRRRSQTPAGLRACQEDQPAAKACADMRRSFQNISTTSWPSSLSTDSIRNSTVRPTIRPLSHLADLDRNFRVRGVHQS
jgi:hypothetical protein